MTIVPTVPILSKPDAILFDWDGTLVDSLPALQSYYNHTLSAFGFPPIDRETARKKIRKSAREIFPEIFGEKADEAFIAYYEAVEKTHLQHLSPFDGSELFLTRMMSLNLPMAIVSNKRHFFLVKEIGHLGWDKYLPEAVGAGEAAKDKPAPDSLLLAVEKLGLSPETHHLWYVGDTETDMMAAQAAGLVPIFIEHGLGTVEECRFHDIHPVCVKNIAELTALVEKFF